MVKNFLVGFIFLWAAPLLAVTAGDPFPTKAILSYEGTQVLDNARLQNKVTIINFWATWCAACKVELKEMQTELSEFLAHKDAQIAYVTLDKEPENAAAWVQSEIMEPRRFLANLYKDPDFALAEVLKIDAFPMTLIIGKDGKVKFVQHGFKEGEGSTAALGKTALKLLQENT